MALFSRTHNAAVALALGVGALMATPATAGAATNPDPADSSYAPVNRAAPAYRTPVATMDQALTCSGSFRNGKEPVYLVPGTAFGYRTQYAWNWAPALTRAGIPWCSITAAHDALGDLSIAGEYDAYAIRKMYALSGGRKIAIVGHSQGGYRPRWALRFFPDTRKMVEDYVGVAPAHHGAVGIDLLKAACSVGTLTTLRSCPQGVWQQGPTSSFVKALNSRQETFAGIDYTDIYSDTDLLVQPADTNLRVAPGVTRRSVRIQSICPLRVADHLTNGSVDSVSWALLFDAVTHRGTADPARISRDVCVQSFLPGLDPVAAAVGAANAPLQIATAVARAPKQTSEAPLPCYVYAKGC